MSIECERCGKSGEPQSQVSIPDNWLYLYVHGFYAGFMDDINVSLQGEPPLQVIICHDCAVLFYRSIPKLQNEKGLHGTDDISTPCCEFAWWIDENGEVVVPED